MKLQKKFTLFSILLLIVPVLATGIVNTILSKFDEYRVSPREVHKFFDRIDEEIIQKMKNGNFDIRKDIKIIKGFDIIAIKGHEEVIFSTKSELYGRKNINVRSIMEFLLKYNNKMYITVQPVINDTDYAGIVIFGSSRDLKKAFAIDRKIQTTIYITMTILTLLILLNSRMISSLNKSIFNLEKASRRIADGDLGFELKSNTKDEIASLTNSFDKMRRALKEKEAQQSRFLMSVSHDLKTPLTSIKGYLEAINDGLADDEVVRNKYLKIINNKAGLLEKRIIELIDFVKLSTDEWRLNNKEIDFNLFIDEAIIFIKEDIELSGRLFSSEKDIPEGIRLKMDPDLFLRALENLASNAIRYSHEGDSISLNIYIEDNKIVIDMHDTGKGIKEQELNYIFEAFYRASNSRNETGSGLGLSTVKSIIESHGWEIKAFSEEGSWSLFRILIPFNK